MTGSVYGTTPSSLQALIGNVRDLRTAWNQNGVLGAAMQFIRKKQRRNILQLIQASIIEIESEPGVIEKVLSSGAAGPEAKAWVETFDDSQKAAYLGSELFAVKRAAVLDRLAELKSLFENASRGQIEPTAIAAAVGGLVDEFLPPADGLTGLDALHPSALKDRAQSLASSIETIRNESRDAALELKMNPDKADAVRDVVGELVSGTKRAFIESEQIRSDDLDVSSETTASAASSEASFDAMTASPDPPPAGSWTIDPSKPFGASKPFERVSTPIAETPPSPPAETLAPPPPIIDRFLERRCRDIMGREVSHFRTNMLLSALARHAGGPNFGALHVTCTDEAEAESRDRFLRGGIGSLLPTFSSGRSAAMATTNRGGCFEIGTLKIAVEHYRREGAVTMVVRVQSHCGVTTGAGGRTFGTFDRYGKSSRACGALQSILEGDRELTRSSEIADTLNPSQIEEARHLPERWRSLLMAALQARTQLEHAMTEIRSIEHPATYILCGSVNLNGLSEPAEIPVILRIVERGVRGERLWELELPHSPAQQGIDETPEGIRITSLDPTETPAPTPATTL